MFTHESTSFLDCVIEGNEGTVPFIPYRAWEERSDWSESDSSIQPLLSSDWSNLIAVSSHCSPLIGQNLIAVSSHCHALCLPVGGASLANDGRSECGVNKCGEALRSTSASASSHTNLEPLVIIFFIFFIFYFFFLFFFFYYIFFIIFNSILISIY